MDRMELLNQLKQVTCPECGVKNNCAVSAGKSINSCWCFGENPLPTPYDDEERCLCPGCYLKAK